MFEVCHSSRRAQKDLYESDLGLHLQGRTVVSVAYLHLKIPITEKSASDEKLKMYAWKYLKWKMINLTGVRRK